VKGIESSSRFHHALQVSAVKLLMKIALRPLWSPVVFPGNSPGQKR
jgi:hypothetical protein